ncbi:MAG: Flp pilus assembly complex ATPase component TadA [Betaproteobacteria bacterium]|nr:Flp pilus assembly complex ATPase component TadA [Betaproteobacteria bacterium]
MFSVEVKSPKGQQNRVDCQIDACTIGKADDNLIVVRGWSVGKRHATIHRRADGYFVEDHGALGATEVNGKIIDKQYGPLLPEDVIRVGDYNIKVLADAAPPAAAPAVEMPAAPAPVKQAAPPVSPQPQASAPAPAAAPAPPPAAHSAPAPASPLVAAMNEARRNLHSKLISQMDLRRLDVSHMGEDALRTSTQAMIAEILAADRSLPAELDRARLAKDVLDEVVGLGPLEDLLADASVSEIMVNRFDEIYVERKGQLTKSDITFSNDQAVLGAIERIVAPIGRRIDESSPMVDARLKDGSRVNAVIPPLALKGCNITIRKFSKTKLVDQDMINYNSVTAEMMSFLKIAVEQAANIVISGGTGSGKTTLLNVMSNYIPDDERIVTVEDAAELQLNKPHLISLESRPPNSEGKGAVSIRDLVKNCLRMRPDRIVVGECRGGEALDMLQAMNTGHDGSLTTAHANTPRDCIARLEVMTLMSGLDLPLRAIREQIASAVHMIVQQSRFPDGSRKVTHITEVTGMEGDIVQLQDIFLFKQDGYDANGKVKGRFVATGNIPDFCQDLAARGIPVDLGIFQPPERR